MNIISSIDRFARNKAVLASFFAIAAVIIAILVYVSVPPAGFPSRTIVTIKDGSTLSQVAEMFQDKSIVRSAFVYKLYVVFLGGSKKIIAGDYLFDQAQSALRVAYRTIKGDQEIPQVKVTIPEGIASFDITRLLAKKMPDFDSTAFQALAKANEGKLFPDTYYFYETMAPAQMVDAMKANFDKQTKSLSLQIALSGRSFDDVINMASIVEKEATSTADRKIIAGILWKRIDKKYPLQVDPPFFYTLGKDSSQLTVADLHSDSPYNLYMNKGLPPTPIGNPGLDAISDTINPTVTDYFFYLSDAHGNMHYAATADGHLANIQKYIQ